MPVYHCKNATVCQGVGQEIGTFGEENTRSGRIWVAVPIKCTPYGTISWLCMNTEWLQVVTRIIFDSIAVDSQIVSCKVRLVMTKKVQMLINLPMKKLINNPFSL